jgi:DNA polymerase III delta subunit
MPESQVCLFIGDPYRIEQALTSRHAAILTDQPVTERITLFGDEVHLASLRIDIRSAPLFAQGRHFVIRHVEGLKAPKPDILVFEEEPPPNTYLTLLAETLKESHPIFKAVKKREKVKTFPPIRGTTLERAAREIFAEESLEILPEAVKAFVAQSGGNLLILSQEAKKLRSFSPEKPVDAGLANRLSFTAGEGSVYPFLDRLGEGNLKAALAALALLSEPPGKMLAAVIRHCTRVLMVRVLIDKGLPAQRIGALLDTPIWVVKKLLVQAKTRSTQDLTEILGRGIQLDLAIKRGALRPEDALLQFVLTATLPPSSRAPGCTRQNPPSPSTVACR